MKEIGVGIIGFGFMGKTHTLGYLTLPLFYPNLPFRVKLVGVCNRTRSVAERAKADLSFEFATDSLDDIFARDDIDVVNICTPNVNHREAILKAIDAGKHFYCDKPLTASYDEAKEVLERLKGKDLINQVALHYRFYPATLRAKQIVEEGRLGRIISFRACYLHSGSVDPNKPIGWKLDKKVSGGGVLYDLGSHALDLMYHLMGEYSSLFAKTQIVYDTRPGPNGDRIKIEADDATYIIAQMKCGAIGTIEASKVATGTNDELRFEIHGDRGAIRFNLMDPSWLEYFDNTVPEAPLGGMRGFTKIESVQRYDKPGGSFPSSKGSVGWLRGHIHCLYNFLSHVNDNTAASPSAEDGAYIQYVMGKAYESSVKGQWIEL
jgi:predicted dehydrogenase